MEVHLIGLVDEGNRLKLEGGGVLDVKVGDQVLDVILLLGLQEGLGDIPTPASCRRKNTQTSKITNKT